MRVFLPGAKHFSLRSSQGVQCMLAAFRFRAGRSFGYSHARVFGCGSALLSWGLPATTQCGLGHRCPISHWEGLLPCGLFMRLRVLPSMGARSSPAVGNPGVQSWLQASNPLWGTLAIMVSELIGEQKSSVEMLGGERLPVYKIHLTLWHMILWIRECQNFIKQGSPQGVVHLLAYKDVPGMVKYICSISR